MLKYSQVASVILGSAYAGITTDHGQYHHHDPNPKVKDYKTGGPITVHVVPHSHDDVGWLKTVDEYFDGSRKDLQWTNVEVELTTVINALLANPSRKFSEVEMKFFSMWYNKQTNEMQESVKNLVKNGQLELINGGWSMHDEACPTYEDMINNMMIGHEFIMKEFGVKPRIGWTIDPFGHSNFNTRLYAELGFDAFFFARLDYQDKNKRMNDKEMEYVWMPNKDSLGTEVNILTHVLWQHYSSPGGFNFDVLDNDPVWVNDRTSEDFNAPDEAQKLIQGLDERAEHYLTDDLFVVFGDDFRYMNAFQNYEYMDNMIEYMNENHSDKYILKYSTPSMYVDALAKHNVEWPTKYDDMMPYSDNPDSYWTGYFSSRANDKEYTRRASSHFEASNQMYSAEAFNSESKNFDQILESKNEMMDALGINQHHDAITGTGTQAVANDYALRLFKAMQSNTQTYAQIVGEKLNLENLTQCFATNSTYLDCPIGNYAQEEGYTMNVVVHNPSTVDMATARLAVPHGHFDVMQGDSALPAYVVCHLDHAENGENFESCFMTVEVATAAWDVTNFKLVFNENANLVNKQEQLKEGSVMESDEIKLTMESQDQSKFTFNYEDKMSGEVKKVSLGLKYYSSWLNADEWNGGQESGMYNFRPVTGQFAPNDYTNLQGAFSSGNKQWDFYFQNGNGPTIEDQRRVIVHVYLTDLGTVKYEVDMNSLPNINSYLDGYEAVVNFEVEDFQNNQTFFTDSNGMEMQKRKLNYRPTWDFVNTNLVDSNENITGNYYPVQSCLSMMDVNSNLMFSVMNDRSQGASALSEGSVEFMQNRRTPGNDCKGMPEHVNETDSLGYGIRVKASYNIQLFDKVKTKNVQRKVQLRTDSPAQYFFNFGEAEVAKNIECPFISKTIKDAGVVENVKLVTIPLSSNKMILRLENVADYLLQGADTQTVNLNKILEAFGAQGSQVKEVTLTGNMEIDEMRSRKIQWKTLDDKKPGFGDVKIDKSQDFDAIKLELQRIRTFEVTLNEAVSFLQ